VIGNDIFHRFAKKAPVPMMVRALLERTFHPERLDAWFAQMAEAQYTRELLFSTLFEMMRNAGIPIPPPGFIPQGGGVPPPGDFPMPPPPPLQTDGEAGRRRAPLPSQEDSLRSEQKQGRYTRAR
jgi:hypothetical protein